MGKLYVNYFSIKLFLKSKNNNNNKKNTQYQKKKKIKPMGEPLYYIIALVGWEPAVNSRHSFWWTSSPCVE